MYAKIGSCQEFFFAIKNTIWNSIFFVIIYSNEKGMIPMKKEQMQEYLNLALSTGADFAEIYYEETKNKNYHLVDSKLDSIGNTNDIGVGIRIVKGEESYYTSTNDLSKENITNMIRNMIETFPKGEGRKVELTELVDKRKKAKIPHDEYPVEKKKDLLYKIDRIARSCSDEISQVSVGIIEMDREYILANSSSKYVASNTFLTRIFTSVYAERGERKEQESIDFAGSVGYELLDTISLEEQITKTAHTAVEKLTSIDFKGGELPVVIAPGFGAVIFHEACGHGLEATSVAPHLSVFSDDFGKKIASDKVTLIDDGTILDAWGSFPFDDEGNSSMKNILIENGVLTKYLVDQFHTNQMKMDANGCGRRQNYRYSTTSRMSNTYLAKGTDKVEDMIKSIDFGVYCEKMSGGSVNPATGDFNFAVDTARLIENGEVKDLLKGITLIGNSKDILQNVEMVSDDLVLSAGFCGSKSGMIPVTIGQPTIKVSKILVGGKES